MTLRLLLALLAGPGAGPPPPAALPPRVCVVAEAGPRSVLATHSRGAEILAAVSRRVADSLAREFPFAEFTAEGGAGIRLAFRAYRIDAAPSSATKEEIWIAVSPLAAGERCRPARVPQAPGEDEFRWAEYEWSIGPDGAAPRADAGRMTELILRQVAYDGPRTELLRRIPLSYGADVRPLQTQAILRVPSAALRADVRSLEWEVYMRAQEGDGARVAAMVGAMGHASVPPNGYIAGILRRVRYGGYEEAEVHGPDSPDLQRLSRAERVVERLNFTRYRKTRCAVGPDGTIQSVHC